MQSWIFSIITPVFRVTWSFRNHSNIKLWCSRNIYYYCLIIIFFDTFLYCNFFINLIIVFLAEYFVFIYLKNVLAQIFLNGSLKMNNIIKQYILVIHSIYQQGLPESCQPTKQNTNALTDIHLQCKSITEVKYLTLKNYSDKLIICHF